MSKKKTIDPAKVDDWDGFFEELNGEKSDRSTAIVSAAFLDVRLEELLRKFLIDEKEVYDDVLNPENSQAILGSFGTRITISYALGLISKEERDELRTIKFIRNRFAHALHRQTFHEEEIFNSCKKLRIPDDLFPDDPPEGPRNRFLFSVSILASRIGLHALRAERERRIQKPKAEIVRSSAETRKK